MNLLNWDNLPAATFAGPPLPFHVANGLRWPASEPFVPESTYPDHCSTRVVVGGGTYNVQPDQIPVVLRGSRHCRLWKHGNGHARYYLYHLAQRFIRKHRITCADEKEWSHYMRCTFFPLFTKHPLWHRQRTVGDRIQAMVNEYHQSMLVDGKQVHLQTGQWARARRLYLAMRRMENQS